MNISTVNELIASLESAGELSIREQKFLKLAKAYQQLAAENVALKNAITDHSHSVHFCEVCGKDDPCSTDDVCYALKDIPATDRIVAGIKAEAKSHDLNAFISHYSAELDNHIANGGDQFDERAVRLRGVIVGARMFREKLRDEEKALELREGAK
ncbi:hypothetical protein [Klebsiella pneumoniae]|uniref:hypothetical protein n=1 Tax=Klebsiella pneumoniae TaxID=573 RepID=UPI001B8B9509|nr:hypothetical protein [Klebsiella pneumoniae]MBR7381535.1 hypothetical protein [Klebsiella pneumoniae]MBR7392880.1 hypothetical protein [Klebsiella pneumoniae]